MGRHAGVIAFRSTLIEDAARALQILWFAGDNVAQKIKFDSH